MCNILPTNPTGPTLTKLIFSAKELFSQRRERRRKGSSSSTQHYAGPALH